jgi:hypothetical protein
MTHNLVCYVPCTYLYAMKEYPVGIDGQGGTMLWQPKR